MCRAHRSFVGMLQQNRTGVPEHGIGSLAGETRRLRSPRHGVRSLSVQPCAHAQSAMHSPTLFQRLGLPVAGRFGESHRFGRCDPQSAFEKYK